MEFIRSLFVSRWPAVVVTARISDDQCTCMVYGVLVVCFRMGGPSYAQKNGRTLPPLLERTKSDSPQRRRSGKGN
uniref:Putative secreted peptide n=1 Tax=Anopheles braziliensis TaxID=58242 RepID=A0A2M3ZMT7_9DIPT